ncbi:MAG TPA: glycosyltransferase family 39 protein [Tepidisphaeraceae bacterium]|jgi:hypothetical protein|nr:glycosyltransferase family 39 protein [Tepidisphaeraceae bacterium]
MRAIGTNNPLGGSLRRRSRGALLVWLCLLPLIGLLLYAQSAWPIAIYRIVMDGGTVLLWIIAATGFGMLACRALRLWDASSPVSLKLATSVGAGLGVLSLALLGLGLAGLLSFATAAALVALGWIAAIVCVRAWHRESAPGALRGWITEPAGWEWLGLLATPFLALALTAALVPPGMLWTPEEPHGYDVVEYHLQIPREWYEAHRIMPLHHNVFSYFPFNVEMHYLMAMYLRGGPWAGMYVCQMMHMTFVVVAVVAVYGIARRRAGAAPAIIAAVSVLTVPWLAQLSAIAYDEGGFLLFGVLSIGWALHAADSRHPRRHFIFAGAMAGFAAGSKLTAVPEVLIAVPLVCAGLAAWKMIARSDRTLAPWRGIALFGLVGLLAFSPWLIRNLRWAGNPVFPELMPLLGRGDFTPVQVRRWELAYVPPVEQRSIVGRAKRFCEEVVVGWQFGYLLLPLGLIAFVSSIRDPMAWGLLGLLAILTIIWLFFTHLQGRFFILAAPVSALLIAQMDWHKREFIGVILVAIFAAVGWVHINLKLLDSVAGEVGIGNVLGMNDLSAITLKQPPLDRVPPDAPLCLVGDARAFWYPLPMSRLRYRTVFDVKSDEPNIVKAWIGHDGKRAGEILLVDPAELKRLSASYYGLPPLPAEVKAKNQRYVAP